MIQPEEKNYHSYLRTFRGDFTDVRQQTDQPDLQTPTPTNVVETQNGYLIQVALPGYKKDQISVKVDEDVLSIRAEVKTIRQHSHHKFHKQEIFSSSFQRSILLPVDVNDENIKATFKDGLLNIDLPKSSQPVKSSLDISIR